MLTNTPKATKNGTLVNTQAQAQLAAASPDLVLDLQVTRLLQVPVAGHEWDGKKESGGAVETYSKGNSLGLDGEGQVRVRAGLWSTEDAVQCSGRYFEASGGLVGSQSDSRDHGCANYVGRWYSWRLWCSFTEGW